VPFFSFCYMKCRCRLLKKGKSESTFVFLLSLLWSWIFFYEIAIGWFKITVISCLRFLRFQCDIVYLFWNTMLSKNEKCKNVILLVFESYYVLFFLLLNHFDGDWVVIVVLLSVLSTLGYLYWRCLNFSSVSLSLTSLFVAQFYSHIQIRIERKIIVWDRLLSISMKKKQQTCVVCYDDKDLI